MAQRIKIVTLPNGANIPLEMRQALIGLEAEASGPVTLKVSGGLEDVYLFPTDLFLQALKEKNQKAYEWFSINTTNRVISIESAVCKKVEVSLN